MVCCDFSLFSSPEKTTTKILCWNIMCNGFRVLSLALISKPLPMFPKFNSHYLNISYSKWGWRHYPNIWFLDIQARRLGGTHHFFYFFEAAHRKVLWPQSEKLLHPRDVLTAPEERTFQTEHRKAKNNPGTQSLPNHSARFYWISHFQWECYNASRLVAISLI